MQIRTLIQMHNEPFWIWLHCARSICTHSAPIPIAPLIIRWGPNAPADWMRTRFRCSQCGTKGAHTICPSWQDMTVGLQPFPLSQMTTFHHG